MRRAASSRGGRSWRAAISYGGRANATLLGASKFGILGAQASRDRVDLAAGDAGRFARHRAPLHLQSDSDRDSCSARARRRSATRAATPCPSSGCRRPRCSARRAPRAPSSTRPMRRIASRPSRGTAAVRGAALGLDLAPTRSPCAPRRPARSVGSVTTAAIGAPARDERVGADARVLLVDHARRSPGGRRPGRRTRRSRARRRSSPPPRSSCPASRGRRAGRRARRASKGRVMPATPTVSMWPQNISERPGARALERRRRRSGRPGAASCSLDRQADASNSCRQRARDRRLARRARHERRVHRVDGDEVAQQADRWVSIGRQLYGGRLIRW